MLTTIRGRYQDGKIILLEEAPVTGSAEVLVTFTGISNSSGSPKPATSKQRSAGYAKGTFTYIAPDFNEPLDDLKDYM